MKLLFTNGGDPAELISGNGDVEERVIRDPFYLKQVKALRSKVVHSLDSVGKRVVGVTSSTDDEGKTTLSLNIASSIAANGEKKVLLVDGDLKKCDMSEKLGYNGGPGLSDYLKKDESRTEFVFKATQIKNLFFMPSGSSVEDSSELLTKNLFANLVDVVKRKFDVVVVDLPPVVSTPDPEAVKNLIDAFIIVYHAGRTPRELLQHTIEEIGEERIMGLVFNRVKMEHMLKYGKKYYYYYRK